MTVDELTAMLRDVPGDVEVRVTDDSGEFEWKTTDAGVVFFADCPPVVYIAEGVLLDELPDEACAALGFRHPLDSPGRGAG
jgi:hypothetical protein